MWIVQVALKRPYTFVVLALLILVISPLVIDRTPTDIFPNINIPVVSVLWQYNGLNAEEMADNPDLDAYVVHNVNTDPQLPFDSDTFDAVVLTVSIQYITQPIAIFQEVWRILRPGGPFVVIFSNRMFPTKAVAIWRMLDDQQHIDLVASYFHYAGDFVGVEARNWSPSAYTDPVYVVLARKAAA